MTKSELFLQRVMQSGTRDAVGNVGQQLKAHVIESEGVALFLSR